MSPPRDSERSLVGARRRLRRAVTAVAPGQETRSGPGRRLGGTRQPGGDGCEEGGRLRGRPPQRGGYILHAGTGPSPAGASESVRVAHAKARPLEGASGPDCQGEGGGDCWHCLLPTAPRPGRARTARCPHCGSPSNAPRNTAGRDWSDQIQRAVQAAAGRPGPGLYGPKPAVRQPQRAAGAPRLGGRARRPATEGPSGGTAQRTAMPPPPGRRRARFGPAAGRGEPGPDVHGS